MNGDGVLSPNDARCAFEIYLNGGVVPPGSDCDVAGDCEASRADVNCCNGVTPGDALAIFERWLSGNNVPANCFAPCVLASKPTESPYRIETSHSWSQGSNLVAVPVTMDARTGRVAFGAEIHFDPAAGAFVRFEPAQVTAQWQGLGAQQVRPGRVIVGGFDAQGLDGSSLTAGAEDARVTIGTLVFQKTADSFALTVDWKEQVLGAGLEQGISVSRLQMGEPYPNPPARGGAIAVNLAIPSGQSHPVTVSVLNVQGRLVKTVLEGSLGAGIHRARWDGTDTHGSRVAAGVYLFQLKAEGTVQTRKIVLVD